MDDLKRQKVFDRLDAYGIRYQWVNCGSQTLPHSGQIFCFTSLTSKLSLPQLIQNLLSDAFGSPQTLHIFIFLSKRQTDFEI